MILLKLPAEARCEQAGCDRTEEVSLVLTGMGVFVFAPKRPEQFRKWQASLHEGNPGNPWLTRCPEHQKLLGVKQASSLLVTPDGRPAEAMPDNVTPINGKAPH